MTDILQRRLIPSLHAATSAVGDETVILHLENGTYYGLDAVGTQIWGLLKDGYSPVAACRRVAEDYGVEQVTVEADARRFLEELTSHDMLIDA